MPVEKTAETEHLSSSSYVWTLEFELQTHSKEIRYISEEEALKFSESLSRMNSRICSAITSVVEFEVYPQTIASAAAQINERFRVRSF
jgi:hypothetical protein